MNRRKFLRGLGAVGAGVALGDQVTKSLSDEGDNNPPKMDAIWPTREAFFNPKTITTTAMTHDGTDMLFDCTGVSELRLKWQDEASRVMRERVDNLAFEMMTGGKA
jgi:hypothetical protein